MLQTKFGDHPSISSVEDVLRFFYFKLCWPLKGANWNDMSKFKSDCHNDATDQILSKSAQQFQTRRRLLTHDDGVSPLDTNISYWAFGSGELKTKELWVGNFVTAYCAS
jgi:hypothetical protein